MDLIKRRKQVAEAQARYRKTKKGKEQERKSRKIYYSSEKNRESNRRYRAKYPLKYKAVLILNHAIELGRIKRGSCEKCGKPKAHAHHDDYSKPLKVRWLCPKHHRDYHMALLSTPI